MPIIYYLIFMAMPALLFFLPLAIPNGKWLIAYLCVSSIAIAALWAQNAYANYRPTGHHTPGDYLGLVILEIFTLVHLAGAATRLLLLIVATVRRRVAKTSST